MVDQLVIVRHGETEWSRSGQHTSVTDLPLLDVGVDDAKVAGRLLEQWSFSRVFSSPRQRARITAELALGTDANIEIREDLAEWHYGEYEGITSKKIHETSPDWWLWTDGAPGGESPDEVTARCDAFIESLDEIEGTVAAFAHSHILRCVAARWIGADVSLGASFLLGTASVSCLSFDRGRRVISLWNQRR